MIKAKNSMMAMGFVNEKLTIYAMVSGIEGNR